jgi:hypothetical protein
MVFAGRQVQAFPRPKAGLPPLRREQRGNLWPPPKKAAGRQLNIVAHILNIPYRVGKMNRLMIHRVFNRRCE